MLGFRAKDPEMRKRFFRLYHDYVGKTLFARLQFIIQTQDWEAVSDVFWLKQGLDLILAILVENEPISLASNSARLTPLTIVGPVPDRIIMPQQVPDAHESLDGTSLSFDSLTTRHSQFLNEASKLVVNTILNFHRGRLIWMGLYFYLTLLPVSLARNLCLECNPC